jgi:hypothetical protein
MALLSMDFVACHWLSHSVGWVDGLALLYDLYNMQRKFHNSFTFASLLCCALFGMPSPWLSRQERCTITENMDVPD